MYFCLALDDLTKEEVIELASNSQCGILSSPRSVFTFASVISSEWKSFALNLNLVDQKTIEEIEYNYQQESCNEMCYQMLLVWAKKRKAQTTVGDLARVIKTCDSYPHIWIRALKETLKASNDEEH